VPRARNQPSQPQLPHPQHPVRGILPVHRPGPLIRVQGRLPPHTWAPMLHLTPHSCSRPVVAQEPVQAAGGGDAEKGRFAPQQVTADLPEEQADRRCGQGFMQVLAGLHAEEEELLAVIRALSELQHGERMVLYRSLCSAFRIEDEEACRAELLAVLQCTQDTCERQLEAAAEPLAQT